MAESLILQIKKIAKRDVDNCFSSDLRKSFLIGEDATGKSYLIPDEQVLSYDEEHLKINNPNEKDINLFCIDSCFFNSSDPKRCDCAVYDNQVFCFCELKLNVSEGTRKPKIARQAKEARDQLGAVIDYFDNNKIDLSDFEVRAYVVMKSKVYPRHLSRFDSIRKTFFDTYEVDLYEKNEIEFL